MTDQQHRATPEQWAEQEKWPSSAADSSCILELRARVVELEVQCETQRRATLEWGNNVDSHSRWIDDHAERIMVLEAGQAPSPSPAAERVRDLQEQIRDGSLTLNELVASGAIELNEAEKEWMRGAPLPPRISTPVPAPADSLVERVIDALIKAECALSDIAEGEETNSAPNTFEWAEQRCAEALAVIRPVMQQHGIRTSEWPPAAQPHPLIAQSPANPLKSTVYADFSGPMPGVKESWGIPLAPSLVAPSLVERVARAIRAERAFFDEPADWHDEARAAIREVKKWLLECTNGYASGLLDEEADQ